MTRAPRDPRQSELRWLTLAWIGMLVLALTGPVVLVSITLDWIIDMIID